VCGGLRRQGATDTAKEVGKEVCVGVSDSELCLLSGSEVTVCVCVCVCVCARARACVLPLVVV
jgi:hypothetical protein